MSMEMEIEKIGTLVAETAQEIFESCGCPDDFCIQTVGMVAVFGGINRLIWSPRNGFQPDKRYCTERFLIRFNEMFKGGF